MGGEELEGVSVEEVSRLKGAFSIDLIDEHLAVGGDHQIAMDLGCDRYFCGTCDVWIEPPCDCQAAENCPFPDQVEKPSMSKGTKEDTGPKTLEGMRKRAANFWTSMNAARMTLRSR